tara:strand:- start:598 stop:888 length:291 start_codon:yes stop_codon:yes gene_type:complete
MGYSGQLPEGKQYDKDGKFIEPEDTLMDMVHSMFSNSPESNCFRCEYLKEDEVSCDAFPDVIPRKILLGQRKHNKPIDGDNGIQFKEKSKEEKTPQ